MNKIVDAIVDLLKVKSLITLSIIGALVFLAVKGSMDIAVFTGIASSVITYYFTRKHEEEKIENNTIHNPASTKNENIENNNENIDEILQKETLKFLQEMKLKDK